MTRRYRKKQSFTERLLGLISEPQFIKFENILSEPNFFKIVGRTHYERWHSCFLGWLLDANGSHLLLDYTLRRFLLLLADEKCRKPDNHINQMLMRLLTVGTFTDIEVIPNENISKETSITGVGRFDVFITANIIDDEGVERRFNCIVELKIDSKPNKEQSKKYADWLAESFPQDVNVLAYITPNLEHDSISTVGDERWYCFDFQLLNDRFLIPLLDHPNLNEKVKPFIIQYIKNLKIRYRGIKMAITNEEKQMALSLYEKYSDVFDSIYDVLVSTGTIDYSTTDLNVSQGRSGGRLAVKINGKVFSNETLRLLFEEVLKYIVDEQFIRKLPLPWGTSRKRYIITNEVPPTHPSGRNFFYPVSYGDYTMESHYSRDRGLKVLSDLCRKLEIDFEIIET